MGLLHNEYKYFLLVAAFGTMVYANVVSRIQKQDHSQTWQKNKKEFTESEWNSYMAELNRKSLLLPDSTCLLVPNCDDKKKKSILEQLQMGDNLGAVVDLNELIRDQLNDHTKKYNVLLNDTLESKDELSTGFKFKFNYKLRPGLFTQLVNDAITSAPDSTSLDKVVILNYPPNVKEAVKFEQNISTNDYLITFETGKDDTVVEYYKTVDKAINGKNLNDFLQGRLVANEESAVKTAQRKLRGLNEPVRLYGETDGEVVERLKSLSKQN